MILRINCGNVVKQAPTITNDVGACVMYTDAGDPICVAMDVNGHVWLKTVDDPTFESTLKVLGIPVEKRDTKNADFY